MIESGEAREIHHMACLIGYGATAINPYLMFESLYELHRAGRLPEGMSPEEAEAQMVKAIGKGLLKVLSKMGDLHDPVLLRRADLRGRRARPRAHRPALHRHRRRASAAWARRARAGGARPPRRAYPGAEPELLPVGGIYAWRRGGELHVWNPETIATPPAGRAQRATAPDVYERFAT